MPFDMSGYQGYVKRSLSIVLFLILVYVFFLKSPRTTVIRKIQQKKSCIPEKKVSNIGGNFDFVGLKDVLHGIESSQWLDHSDQCATAKQVIYQLFDIEIVSRHLAISTRLQPLMDKWFNGRPDLVRQFQNQTVVSIFNRWSRTTTVSNPLRAARPRSADPDKMARYLADLDSDSKRSQCDFCQKLVASDPLGMIETDRVYVAANAFKLRDYHALFVVKKHNPLKLEREDFVDLLRVANLWFKRVYSDHHDPDVVIYPTMIWDSLQHAGASQEHTHLHGFSSSKHYLGQFRAFQQYSSDYKLAHPGSDYIEDYINAHIALGLGFRLGQNVLLS